MADIVAAAQARFPQYKIVDAIPAPGGGIWAVGEDGGVFALDGAPFFGSYHTIDPAHRNDPDRRFVNIQENKQTGGYDLVTARGERYGGEAFGDRAFMAAQQQSLTGGGQTTDPGQPGTTAVDANQTTLRATLDRLGLGGLADEAWADWKTMGGTASMPAVNDWLRQQPKFQERFPALKELEKKNIFWSPGEYLAYEADVRNKMAGLPADFMEDKDIADLAVNGWSVDEVSDAVAQAKTAALTMPAEDRQALQDYYGIGAGELTAFWLNPDKAVGMIERKARTTIAGIGGEVGKSLFGGISKTEAESLYQAGVTGDEAAQQLGGMTGFLSETLGEQGTDLTRETALGAVTGSQADLEAIRKRQAARQAAFSGGGGAAGGGQGKTGLGSA